MIKMFVTGRRRQDLSLAEFDEYWKSHHAALARDVASALGIKRYVQSIRFDAPGLEVFSEGRGDGSSVPDFVAELWFENAEELAAAFASPEGKEANERLARDEEEFVDRSSLVCIIAQEREQISE